MRAALFSRSVDRRVTFEACLGPVAADRMTGGERLDGGPEGRAASSRAIPEVLELLIGEGANEAEVGVFIFDDDGNYVAANQHGANLLGVTVAELLTRRAGDFTVGNPPPADILPSSHRESVQMVRRADGEWIPTAFLVVPTTVSKMPFRIAIVWQLEADDPRAVSAAAELAARQTPRLVDP